jgi:hypothetical protein
LPRSKQDGNVMSEPEALGTNTNLGVIVNAWDNISPIGNGGSMDRSVDGMYCWWLIDRRTIKKEDHQGEPQRDNGDHQEG